MNPSFGAIVDVAEEAGCQAGTGAASCCVAGDSGAEAIGEEVVEAADAGAGAAEEGTASCCGAGSAGVAAG